jgi:hypothetical protein
MKVKEIAKQRKPGFAVRMWPLITRAAERVVEHPKQRRRKEIVGKALETHRNLITQVVHE